MISGVVAIVGRPNVGKSTLFNRMIGTRVSIIDDTAGVTRDRIYGKASWLTREFRVIDTGGIQLEDQPFAKEIAAQVEIAVDEANVIIMVTNGMAGVTSDDQMIARMLRKSGKPVILAVNHIDDGSQIGAIYDFYQLGLGDPLAISCLHGIGIGDLLDGVVSTLSDIQLPDYQGSIAFSFIGRPNVGKSSLVNALLHQQRVIVSNISGTTRDAIDTPFQANGIDYVCIDTAGIRKKGKVYENIEKYSVLRSLSAIERSDVVVFVLDGESGIVDQDKHVAGYAHEAGKPIVIVYNKWDTVEKDDKTADEIRSKIKDAFVYLSYAPILFVSAQSGQRVNEILDMVNTVYQSSQLRIATNVLNEVIQDAQLITPAPAINGKRLKIYYATQVSVAPPTFVLSVNDEKLMHFSYQRYIENRLREAFGFEGTPIHIIVRKKV